MITVRHHQLLHVPTPDANVASIKYRKCHGIVQQVRRWVFSIVRRSVIACQRAEAEIDIMCTYTLAAFIAPMQAFTAASEQ